MHDETFLVTQGTLRFHGKDGAIIDAHTGDYVTVPPRAPHTFVSFHAQTFYPSTGSITLNTPLIFVLDDKNPTLAADMPKRQNIRDVLQYQSSYIPCHQPLHTLPPLSNPPQISRIH